MASIADGANGAASVQALAAYFRDLDSIQEELEQALGDWETPVILVFGAESAGKSTILERVAMLPLFPKGDGICTRLPILVQLRQSKDDRPPRLTVVEDEKVVDYEDMDTEEEIRKIMEETVKRENDDVIGISKRSYLKLVVTGPDFPNLDLLDLPGLVVNPGTDEPGTWKKTRTNSCILGLRGPKDVPFIWPYARLPAALVRPKSIVCWQSIHLCWKIRLAS